MPNTGKPGYLWTPVRLVPGIYGRRGARVLQEANDWYSQHGGQKKTTDTGAE